MPRKKKDDLTSKESVIPEKKPARTRSTAKVQSQDSVPADPLIKAPRRTQKKANETEPTVKRTRTSSVPSTEPEVESVPVSPAKARTKSRTNTAEQASSTSKSVKAKSRSKSEATFLDTDDDVPIPTFRPRSSASKPTVPGPDRPKPKSRPQKSVEDQPSVHTHAEFVVGEDLPVPVWRQREGGKVPIRASVNVEEPRGISRRRRNKPDITDELVSSEVIAEEPVVAVPEIQFRRREKKQLAPPPKPLISTPPSAPQVIIRDGLPTLVRNGQVYPPVFFFGGSSDERSASTVLEELRMASEAGIHLHSHLVELEIDDDVTEANIGPAAYLLAKSVETDPDSQVLFRIVFKARRGWQQRFPKGRYLHEDGALAEPSVCDDEFWSLAKKCLEDFVQGMMRLDKANHILGLHLDRGEWFFGEGWGYDTSDAATVKFREWTRVRYLDDEVMLRASWFDGNASFDMLQVPTYQPEGAEGDKFVRSSRKQRKYVDYHLFLSDATVQRIGDLAYAVKEASQGNFIVGASYGYTFEWSHPANGHLSLGKLLRTPEIDFIAGPPSYRSREPGGTAPFPGPIDSFALNGKLYISEEDFKTSLSGGREPDDFNPVIKTPQALESVHWRGAGAALSHGTGVSWMDLWGNGWLKTSSIWSRAGRISSELVHRMACGTTDPEICVFIDERALAYLVDRNAFTLLVQNVRESVLKAGVNAGFYLLSDLAHREKFPEAKAYIFLNAWDLRPDLRAAIKSRLQRDGKVLFWLYSAGLFDSGRDSLERAREVTGIALKPQPFYSKSGTTILNRRHPLCEAFPDRSIASGTKLEPSYFAIPEDATILGEYSQTGLPSFVVKEVDGGGPNLNWTSVFLGEPMVNPALIRALAQMANVHVWNFSDDVVHVRAPFLTVHCAHGGPRTITLPSKWSAYNLQQRQWIQPENTNLRFQATDGSTHTFLVGSPEDIEAILTSDPVELLKVSEIPAKMDNTLAGDAASFDIPLMKLDEWMEGGDADEVADEWFLRPVQIEEETPTPIESERETGRRRRRRRRNGDRSGSEETADFRPEYGDSNDDELGISVVFRKRE